MSHVRSSPGQEEKRTMAEKRRARILSPEALSAKRRKIMDLAPVHQLEGVTERTGPSSEAPGPSISSTRFNTDVCSDQTTSPHEMVLKDASTDELLVLLGEFLCHRCCLIKDLSPGDPLLWLSIVDISLFVRGCQRHRFIGPGSVVFLYMLCRDTVSAEVSSMRELQAVVLTCFYVACAYIGHELGYPALPFLVEEDRGAFWKRTLDIIDRMSGKMLQINNDPQFFADVFADLRSQADHVGKTVTEGKKIMDLAPLHQLEGVTERTGPSSEAPGPSISSTRFNTDVCSDQTTSPHEMVLKDASTDELLTLLGEFLCRRCCLIEDLSPEDLPMWLNIVDISLFLGRRQRHRFIGPGSVVFLYMLCRDTVSAEVSSMRELQAVVFTCFYVAYAYIGHEISYPALPFLVEEDRGAFWKRTLDIIDRMSGKMLQINNDPQFFADVFADLRNQADHVGKTVTEGKKKILDLASGAKLEGVAMRTITTNHQPGGSSSSEAPGPSASSIPFNTDVRPDQTTSTHEMVLKDTSTDELLTLLGQFLCRRCCLIKDLSPEDPPMWLNIVDISLFLGRCQRHPFIGPGSVVFLYMLCRDTVSAEVSSMRELQAVVLTCFYVAYAYIGHEISYPALPFLVEEDREAFWKRTLDIIDRMSGKMLQINNDPQFFADVFADLRNVVD